MAARAATISFNPWTQHTRGPGLRTARCLARPPKQHFARPHELRLKLDTLQRLNTRPGPPSIGGPSHDPALRLRPSAAARRYSDDALDTRMPIVTLR
jgi:hypothetical protein